MAPPALDVAVMSYDRVTTNLLSQQLLLNIARARHHQPIHFTAVSNIAATFDFRFNAGALPSGSGASMVPTFGGSVAENPTITIVPIEGEEFTKRLLNPAQEAMVSMLFRQGADIDLVLRLLAGEYQAYRGKEESLPLFNTPSDPGYSAFRRMVLHLATIQDRNALHVEPLHFKKTLEFPEREIKPDNLADLEKTYTVYHDEQKHTYRLTKSVIGRVIMSNYDPDALTNEERIKLNDWAESTPLNELSVDIRPGHVGGEFPMHGEFKLRSLAAVINFLGRGIHEEPEFPVERDPRTPRVAENPARTLGIFETEDDLSHEEMSLAYRDFYYTLMPDDGYQWNRQGFALLHQIFQMTVTDLPRAGIPSLTIAK